MTELEASLQNLQEKMADMVRVLNEEAAWWKAGCPERSAKQEKSQ